MEEGKRRSVKGAHALGELQGQNTTLTKPNLYHNDIGAEGTPRQDTSPTNLNLEHNDIGAGGALRQDTAPTNLNIEHNDISNEGALRQDTILTNPDLSHKITLFCIMSDDPITRAFPVRINSMATISDLKKLIKIENHRTFSDVDAKDILLWVVNIPVHNHTMLNLNLEGNNAYEPFPTKHILDIFPTVNTKHIHVIVALPGISELDVLRLIPPSIRSISRNDKKPTTCVTRSTFRRTPSEVANWDDFLAGVKSYIPSAVRRFDRNHFIFDESLSFSGESTLHSALDRNVYTVLDRLVEPEECFGAHDIVTMLGEADRVFYDTLSNSLLIAIEIKTKFVLSSDDLVQKYNGDIDILAQDTSPENSVTYQVQQIFGYLLHNHLQYGILTTYDQTWFLKRNMSNLYISPTINHTDQEPTLFQCYAYIMRLSRQNSFNESSPPSPPPNFPGNPSEYDDDEDYSDYTPNNNHYREGKRKRRGGNKSSHKYKKESDDHTHSGRQNNTQNTNILTRELSTGFTITIGSVYLSEFKRLELIGTGRSGNVFSADWHGEVVAMKVCDLWQHPEYEEEMLTEVAVYEALKNLQGHCIPHIKHAGYDGGIFVLATELAGLPLELSELNRQERIDIVEKLSLIHTYGILHNDIRPENILIRRDDNGLNIRFIDFALSERTESKSKRVNEKKKLEKLLNIYPL